jgi:glycosyltransferase involved in cell wall biosynthesis
MRVCFISGREPSYTRNAVILNGLKENGTEVIECTSYSCSYLTRYPSGLCKFLLLRHKADVIFIGFFGQPLVPIVKMLTHKPIVLDAFISGYDTLCFDRKKFKPNSLPGKFLYWLDRRSCECANMVLLDTNAHIKYFTETFGLDRGKFRRVFVGAEESNFYPREIVKANNKFKVLYYGSYLPIQGIEYIISAAKALERYEDISFKIIGKGPESEKIKSLVKAEPAKNIQFIDWRPYHDLPLEIAHADICLGGHFSNIDKAKRVIAGKTFQQIAMKKPVILGDNPANRELFQDRKNALLCELANPDALTAAILELKNNDVLRNSIAEEGYKTFLQHCTTRLIGEEIVNILQQLTGK